MQSRMVELRNTAVGVLLAIPAYPDWLPPLVRTALVLLAVSVIVWTWIPMRLGRKAMTFGVVLMIVSCVGLVSGALLHFFAPTFMSSSENPNETHAGSSGAPTKNSPNISAGRDVNIGHVGDVINPPINPADDLTKNEGILVPANLPNPNGIQSHPDYLLVYYGSNSSWVNIFPHTVLEMGGDPMIAVDKDLKTGNLIVTSLKIFGEDNKIIATIDQDGFWVINTSRKKRPDKSTLVVYDSNDIEVLKIVFLNPQTITVRGIFRHRNVGTVVITDSEMKLPGDNRLSRNTFIGAKVSISVR